MKHKRSAVFLSLLLVILLVMPLSAFAVTQSDIEKVQAERDELTQKQQQTQSKIDQLREEQASAIEQKNALDERNTYAAEQLALIQEQIKLYHAMIDEKALEVEAARDIEEEQLQRLRVRIRAMEENGGFDLLSLLINADSFSEVLSAMDDIGQIMEADRMLEDDYIAARESHEQTKAEYEAMMAKLQESERELLDEQEQLRQMIEEATALIAQLDEDIEEAIREYEEAERQRAAADAKISALIAELNKPKPTPAPAAPSAPPENPSDPAPENPSDPAPENPSDPAPENPSEPTHAPEAPSEPEPTPAPETPSEPEPTPAPDDGGDSGAIGTGSLMWPVPSSHVVTSRYGYRIHPITGEEKFHSGIDIDGYGNEGGAIVACDNGTVVSAEWYGGYGNCVIIDHGNGMQTLYGHMSSFSVSAGDIVSQGQTIGGLGSTGVATGTHCHLEVFVNGSRVDPAGYFSGITYYDC